MYIDYDESNVPRWFTMFEPFDMHDHGRDSEMLSFVIPFVLERFAGAVFMPNLVLPITTAARMASYREEIIARAGAKWRPDFQPLMTLYMTDKLEPAEIDAGSKDGLFGAKYYPPGLTTNSDSGIEKPSSLWTPGTKPYECLIALQRNDKALLLHAADGVDRDGVELDPYDQEKHFLDETLPRIRDAHPELRISFEHMSTAFGAEAARKFGGPKLGFTMTPQHLLLDRRDVFRRGFHSNRSWLPVIQPKEHRDELRKLVGEGHSFVFLGTDSAPHPVASKYADCCAGGVLTAHAAVELYAEAFEDMGKLEFFEAFASLNGPRFHGIEPSTKLITLKRKPWKVPHTFWFAESAKSMDDGNLIPFRAGETVRWRLSN